MPRPKEQTDYEMIEKLTNLYTNYGSTNTQVIREADDMLNARTYTSRLSSVENARSLANVEEFSAESFYNEMMAERKMRELERGRERVVLSNADTDLKRHVRKSNKTFTDIRERAGLILDHTNETNRSRIEMIEELRKLESPISGEKAKNKTSYSPNQYRYEFGSFTDAVNLAGKETALQRSERWECMTGIGDIETALKSIDEYKDSAEYYVYRLHFNDGFYIGMTIDVKRRVAERHGGWPSGEPEDIDIESFDDRDTAESRETELFYQTAIDFDTVNVYGGNYQYDP